MTDPVRDEIRRVESRLSSSRYKMDRYGNRLVPWTVYGIYDLRDLVRAFYIGVTRHLSNRAECHYGDPDMPVREEVLRIEAEGSRCVARSIAQFYNEDIARFYEKILIATTPGLLNRSVSSDRFMVVPPHEMADIEAAVTTRKRARLLKPLQLPPASAVAASTEIPKDEPVPEIERVLDPEYDQSRRKA